MSALRPHPPPCSCAPPPRHHTGRRSWRGRCFTCGGILATYGTCRFCGKVTLRGNQAAHRKSRSCQATQVRCRYEADGKAPTAIGFGPLLDQCGIPNRQDVSRYRRRGIGPGCTTYVLYVDRWVADLLAISIRPVLLERILQHPEAPRVVGAALQLGVMDAAQLCALLQIDTSIATRFPT